MTTEREQFALDALRNNPAMMLIKLHNVRLIDVTADADGNELLHVETENGARSVLAGHGKMQPGHPTTQIGNIGSIERVTLVWERIQPRACRFEHYRDQSLRRAPELDFDASSTHGRKPNVLGWRCDARPGGFWAPVGLTPGEDGRFIEDQSFEVTLRVPSEFDQECKRYGMTCEQMLRGFVADAAGISNYFSNPRADGFSSNGSDEREMADAWMQRAYFAQFEEAEAAEAEAERLEEEQERRAEEAQERDEFGDLLEDWKHVGGDTNELIAAVQKLIDEKSAA